MKEFKDQQLVQIFSDTPGKILGRIASHYSRTAVGEEFYQIRLLNGTVTGRYAIGIFVEIDINYVTPAEMKLLTTKEILQLVKINRK